jgi:hypothetical protein
MFSDNESATLWQVLTPGQHVDPLHNIVIGTSIVLDGSTQ